MTATGRPVQRAWGGASELVPLGYRVERDAKEQFDALAGRAGISKALMFELLVRNVALRDDGLPTWWPESEQLAI